jgi:hypothetical protein
MVVKTLAINYVIQFKRQHSAIWEEVNPILKLAEPGFESDTGKAKIGDGITAWNNLKYLALNKDSEVVTTMIADEAITEEKISDGAVTGRKIDSETITNSNIASNAQIDVSKLSGVVSQFNGTMATSSPSDPVVRNITASTEEPSGGQSGDIWVVYLP